MAFKSVFAFLALTSFTSLSAGLPAPQNNTGLNTCAASMDGVLPSPRSSDFIFSSQIRRYYIAAEQVTWDYIPTGWDNWLGVPIGVSPRAYAAGYTTENSLGTKWQKAMYRAYTDASFTKLVPQPA